MSDAHENPYEAPAARSHDGSATPWKILSAVLFALLVCVGFLFYRAMITAEVAKEQAMMQAQRAAEQSEMAREAAEQAAKERMPNSGEAVYRY